MERLQTERTMAGKQGEITDEECRGIIIRVVKELTEGKLRRLYWFLDGLLKR